jgi:hypothetical protein
LQHTHQGCCVSERFFQGDGKHRPYPLSHAYLRVGAMLAIALNYGITRRIALNYGITRRIALNNAS